jgi:hypothetical protein
MSEGGTVKAQLEKVEQEIEEEMKLWMQAELPPPDTAWGFGHMQLHASIRLDTLVDIIRDELGVPEEKMDLVYKRKRLAILREMRPAVMQARSEAQRNAILDGIMFKPPPDINPMN